MRNLAVLLLSTFLIPCNRSLAQNKGTNAIARAEAIKIASQLPEGMRHADALKVLEGKGLNGQLGGRVLHHTVFNSYKLKDGCRLTLGYALPPRRDDDLMAQLANSRLSEAYIASNGVPIVYITLTNAP